ncbi:MAG: 30S ribosomal protein S17 [Candidatus Woesearchaeota archaeon]|nr:MAG: 30S ribosomal protein S17 [Candidatus Woesearchaeota archaeon]
MKKEIRNIGIKTKKPEIVPKVKDDNDPYFGSIRLRGRIFTGTVISDKMMKTVTVEWPRRVYNKKYERFEVRRTRVKAHNPESMNAKVGDKVKIAETRPISKTKNFVVIEVIKKGQ